MIGEVSRDARPGDLVEVIGKEGTRFGWGLWNPKSRMPLRIVSHSLDEIDESFFETAIRRAACLRREILGLDAETDSYRAIHGDADFLPGMVADKFADVLSVEITNLAAWQRLPNWLPLLHECFGTQRVVVSVDQDLARVEDIPRTGGVAVRCRPLGENPRTRRPLRSRFQPGPQNRLLLRPARQSQTLRQARRRPHGARSLLLYRRFRHLRRTRRRRGRHRRGPRRNLRRHGKTQRQPQFGAKSNSPTPTPSLGHAP